MSASEKTPNKAPEPTSRPVTDRAAHAPRQVVPWLIFDLGQKMKRLIAIGLTTLLAACSRLPTEEVVRKLSERVSPATLRLEAGFNSYVRCALLADGSEVGMIRMKDGASSDYWFRSHHLTGDIGGTWFAMSDGTKCYMAGLFCCEVQLPELQFADLASLKQFVRKHHGIAP